MKFSTHIEMPVVVEYHYHKGTPGRTSGPPEHCYPAEPAWVEIESVSVNGVEITLDDKQAETLEQEIEEMITAKEQADQEAYWESLREMEE